MYKAPASRELGTWKYRDEVKPRVNRQGEIGKSAERSKRPWHGILRRVHCHGFRVKRVVGCEVIERSKCREMRRSGKAPSEASGRGTRFRCVALPCPQFKGKISQPRNLIAPQNHNLAVSNSKYTEPQPAVSSVRGTTETRPSLG